MSYATMDHPKWVEAQIAAAKRSATPPLRSGAKWKGKGWLAGPDKLSEFQAKVIHICGMVGGGIYNAPIGWSGVIWDFGTGMAVPWRSGMATFDFAPLTRLVFLCHEARIRCEIDVHGPRLLALKFWQRRKGGDMSERHPNLDEAVAAFWTFMPKDHQIIYRATDRCEP